MDQDNNSPRTVSELMEYLHQREEEAIRLHSLGAPSIGIFFVVDHRVFPSGNFKDLVTPDPDGVRWIGFFESHWRSLTGSKIVQGGLYHYPRGRIVFNDSLSKFFLYVDRCLLESESRSALNQVLIEFNLDPSEVTIMPSRDCKCSRCHCHWGLQQGEVEMVKRPDVEASAMWDRVCST